MSEVDLPAANRLRELAGWNQRYNDWQRLLRYQTDGCFVAVHDSDVVGTVTTTCYCGLDDGPSLAWIGMMLVNPDFRRQGIGTQLMQRALQFLNDCDIDCIKLDATAAGAPVYERLGFRKEWTFHRWVHNSSNERPQAPKFSESITELHLDQRAFGADRQHWLRLLAADSTVRVQGASFGMLRPGSHADYLGPVTATDPGIAKELIGDLLSHTAAPVYWDIPSPNQAGEELAEQLRFERTRELTRMWTGSKLIKPNTDLLFALSDPGTG